MIKIKIVYSLFFFFFSYVFSFDYDGDCSIINREYTYKNSQLNDKNEWIDSKQNLNFTFIASSADDCKGRTIRQYKVTQYGYYYDTAKDEKDFTTVETNYKHCCFFKYDNMEKYEGSIVLTRERDTKTGKTNDVTEEKITGRCIPLTEYQYKHIGDYIEYQELSDNNIVNLKIDCNATNLHFLFLSLILLFLF